jgi:hypothetical protein
MKQFFLVKTRAFTVLEFIIITAIIVTLLGITLGGINTSRKHARDQVRIANIKRIEIGLADFRQVCGHYPSQLQSWSSCDKLQSTAQNFIRAGISSKQLSDFIPDIDSFDFNGVTSTYTYTYAGITYDSSLISNSDCATGYHIGVRLEDKNTFAENDSQFDSAVTGVYRCNAQTSFGGLYNITVKGFTGTGYYDKLIY